MKHYVFLTSLFFSASVFAQEEIVKDQPTVADSFVIRKLLIIPFDPKMYISDADADLRTASGLDFKTMVTRFREGLRVTLKNSVPGWWVPLSIDGKPDSAGDALLAYKSINYRYELLDEKTMGSKAPGKSGKPEAENKIVKGQLHVEKDDRPKFMNIAFKNDTILDYLSDKYGANYFLFINQLDFVNDLASYAASGNKELNRLLRIHYSIFAQNGQQHFAGLAIAKVPSGVKDIQTIINDYFPVAAKTVVSHLPPPVPVKIKKTK